MRISFVFVLGTVEKNINVFFSIDIINSKSFRNNYFLFVTAAAIILGLASADLVSQSFCLIHHCPKNPNEQICVTSMYDRVVRKTLPSTCYFNNHNCINQGDGKL